MKTKTLVLTAILLSSATALAAVPRTFTQLALTAALDGNTVGSIKKVEGGYLKSSAVSERLGPERKVRKHIAAATIEPLTLTVASSVDPSFFDWATANWGGRSKSKTLELTACDLTQKAVSQTTYRNALPFEVTVPTLDASSKEVGYFTVKVAPESLGTAKSSGKCDASGARKQKPWQASNFRLELDGVDGSGVSSIDSFTVKTTLNAANAGAGRDTSAEASPAQFPDLHLTVGGAHAQDFVTWFNDFVVQGHSDQSHEKQGAIVLLDPTLKKELGRISLSGVGILNAAPPSSDSDDYAVDLYVEGMTMSLSK